MASSLANVSRRPIPGWNGTNNGTCTNAVVYWLWCVAERRIVHDPGAFLTFLQNAAAGGGLGSTARFIAHMVRGTGTERTRRAGSVIKPWKGSLVVFMEGRNAPLAAHACVNGGNNTLYGYNQQGWLAGCMHGAHSHCGGGHPTSSITWDNYGYALSQGPAGHQYDLFTVKEFWAVRWFTNNRNDTSKW